MTDAPETRDTHVIRILGTNKNGDVLQDIWADVERIDKAKYVTQTKDSGYQGVVRKFRWQDDPDSSTGVVEPRTRDGIPVGDPQASRDVITVKVCSPDEDNLSDPSEWIPIDVIKRIRFKDADQGRVDLHINEQLTAAREVNNRRVFHRNTTIDAVAQAAFAADPARKVYVARGQDYNFTDSDGNLVPSDAVDVDTSVDKDQYIEQQVITRLKGMSNDDTGTGSGSDQGVSIKLLNQYIIDQTDDAKLARVGRNDINPPYRLDPYQNIVNIQFAITQEAVLGIAALPVIDSDFSGSGTQTSKDGAVWDATLFGANTSNAASGLGKTVVCSGSKFIAFGKPSGKKSDGSPSDPCFITAKGATIQRGVLNSGGDLEWTTVGTLPLTLNDFNGVNSCSFAGGAFFVSYTGDDGNIATYFAVSFDGLSFTMGIQPFNGVVAASLGSSATGIRGTADPSGDPSPVGGNVAYDKTNKVYVTTGSYNRNYVGLDNLDGGEFATIQLVDQNFMSSTSMDGIRWTPKFDTSECGGFGATADGATQKAGSGTAFNVTFGNGMFVAATGYKFSYNFFGTPTFVQFNLTNTACSVATSPDGKTWTNRRLPESISTPYVYGAHNDSGGIGTSVGFFKTKTNNSGVNGFFVATGLEFPAFLAPLQSKIWRSDDGLNWTLVRTDTVKSDWILSAINKSHGTVVTT